MKRSLALILTLASGFVLSAAAQTPAAPATAGPAKIAVIAFQVAVAQTNEGQRNFADLQKKYDPKRQQLKTLSDEIDNLTKQLQAQAATLTPAEQQSKAAVIDNKKKQLDRDSQDASNDFQQEMQDVYNTLASKVYDVMQSYAELHGYTLVLDVSVTAVAGALCRPRPPTLPRTSSTHTTRSRAFLPRLLAPLQVVSTRPGRRPGLLLPGPLPPTRGR